MPTHRWWVSFYVHVWSCFLSGHVYISDLLLPSEDPAISLPATSYYYHTGRTDAAAATNARTGDWEGKCNHNEVGRPVPAIFQWMGRRFLGAQWTKFRSLVNTVCLGVAAIARAP